MSAALPILAITGPTAVGKTGLSLALAGRLGAEIVSVDSRQIYRGLDIGTAKPSMKERARIAHHFIDERDPTAPISAGAFAREAEDRIEAIRARGSHALLVGGSMLYLNALAHGIADVPPIDPGLQAQVREQAATADGRADLYRELTLGDPRAAETLDPSKSHRLIRLVSVLRSAGPPSEFWDNAPPPRHTIQLVALNRDRAELYARIDARVYAMVEAGLVEETQSLLAQGYDPEALPLRTIGYREAAAYLHGTLTLDEMVGRIQRDTRRFAKRQLTWLRRDATVLWIHADASPQDVVDAVTTNRA